MRDEIIDNAMDERPDYPSIRASKLRQQEEEDELENINQMMRACEDDEAEDQMDFI